MHLRRKSLVFSHCSEGSACNGVLNWKAGTTTKRDSTAYRLIPISKTNGFKLLLLQAQMMWPQKAALNSQLQARNVAIAAVVAVAGRRDISSSTKKATYNTESPRYGYLDSKHQYINEDCVTNLESVPYAVAMASERFLMYIIGFFLVNIK